MASNSTWRSNPLRSAGWCRSKRCRCPTTPSSSCSASTRRCCYCDGACNLQDGSRTLPRLFAILAVGFLLGGCYSDQRKHLAACQLQHEATNKDDDEARTASAKINLCMKA